MELVFAVIDPDTLSCMGMQQLLEDLIPSAEVAVFHSFEALTADDPGRFVHFFVSSGIYFEHAAFFLAQPRQTIVLVRGHAGPNLSGLRTLNVCQEEKDLVKSLLHLQQRGHAGHDASRHPSALPHDVPNLLSARETEVAVLLAKGCINKEIADRLGISLTTVISHRKSIMAKLRARSLADIIIYVVTHGLAPLDEL
ncbi:MAG: helix-turn-helix transcriptional regulator [Bacteroidales bacterium]|nr:helix-turn-helix transcriptional regulator [Bacteroidales bacterium]